MYKKEHRGQEQVETIAQETGEPKRRQIRERQNYKQIAQERSATMQQFWYNKTKGIRDFFKGAKDYTITIPDRVGDRIGQAADLAVMGKEAVVSGVQAGGRAIKRGAETTGRGIKTAAEISAGVAIGVPVYLGSKAKEGGAYVYKMGKEGVDSAIKTLETTRDSLVKEFLNTVEKIKEGYKTKKAEVLNTVDGIDFSRNQKKLLKIEAKITQLTDRAGIKHEKMDEIGKTVLNRCNERAIPLPKRFLLQENEDEEEFALAA